MLPQTILTFIFGQKLFNRKGFHITLLIKKNNIHFESETICTDKIRQKLKNYLDPDPQPCLYHADL